MGSGSKGATTSQSSSQPPPQVMAQYENVIAQANKASQTPYTPYTGNLVQGFSPEQLSAFQTVNNAQGIAQPYYNAAANYATLGAAPITAANIANYYNPYQQTVINATEQQQNLQNAQQQSNLEGSLMGSGGLFNDRLGVAQAQLAGQQAIAEAPVIAGLEQQGYTQALGAAQAQQGAYANAAYSLGNLGASNLNAILTGAQAQLGTGGLEQQLGQTGLSTAYQQWQQQQAYPFQDISWLSGISTGLGSNMGGTSQTTTTPPLSSQIAPFAGLGIAGLALLKKGGGIHLPRHYEGGGGIDRPRYDFGGGVPTVPWGNVAAPYIPQGIQITHGSGPPRPPGAASSSANPLDKTAQDAIKLATSWNKSRSPSVGSPSDLESSADAGAGAGGLSAARLSSAILDPGSVASGFDIGSPFVMSNRGGGIRRHFDAGGDATITPDAQSVGLAPLPASPTQIDAPSGISVAAAIPSSASPTAAGWPAASAPAWPNDPVPPSAAPWGGDAIPSPASAPYDESKFSRPTWMPSVDQGTPAAASGFTPTRSFSSVAGPPPPARDLNAVQEAPVAIGRDALSYGASPVSMDRAKNAIGTFESGNNYGEVGVPTKLGRALGRYQVMEKELPGQLRQAGLPPMTPKEFLNDPAAQDKLFETVFGGLQDRYGNFNDAASMWFSGHPVATAGNRRDALGTTVPMYLANTNAILARDLGERPTGGIHSPATVVDSTTGRGVGAAHVVDGSGRELAPEDQRKHLFSPEVRSALLKAGFALMANRSPYLAQAIGDAGLVGVSSYEATKRYEDTQAREQRKDVLNERMINARINQLDQAAKNAAKHLDLQTKQAANTELYRQAQIQHMTAQEQRAAEAAEAGKHPGYRWADEEHTHMEAIPGGPADPKVLEAAARAKKPAVAGMSPELQEVNARQIVAGNLSPLVGLPRTPEGLQIRNALRQQAVQLLMNERGMSVEQAAGALNDAEQRFKSNQIGINAQARTAGTREENLNIILRAAAGAVPAAIEASDEVARLGGPITPLNRLIQRGEVMSSDPAMVKFGMANLQLAEHWARAMNPTGVMRESDRDMALHFLDTGLSNGTYKAAVLQLQKQITRERDAIRNVDPRTPINPNAPTPAPGAGTEGAAPAAAPPKEGDTKRFKQGWGVFRGGQWQPLAAPVVPRSQ